MQNAEQKKQKQKEDFHNKTWRLEKKQLDKP